MFDGMTSGFESDLPEKARRAIERARAKKLSYAVRMVRAPDGRIDGRAPRS
jgi:hypothetical protein